MDKAENYCRGERVGVMLKCQPFRLLRSADEILTFSAVQLVLFAGTQPDNQRECHFVEMLQNTMIYNNRDFAVLCIRVKSSCFFIAMVSSLTAQFILA